MSPRLMKIVYWVLLVLALVLAGQGYRLIDWGMHPVPGAGSLGHVGVIIAGGAMIFLGLICGLFVLYFRSRIKRKGQGQK